MMRRYAVLAGGFLIASCDVNEAAPPGSTGGSAPFATGGAATQPPPATGGAPSTGGLGTTGGVASGGANGGAPSGQAGGVAGGGMSGSAPGGASTGGSATPPVVSMVGKPYTFPQNKRSSYCSYPAAVDPNQAKLAYERWKTELVTSEGAGDALRVRRPANEEDTTVSEGIAYGMILAVTMDDQTVFDKLWKYSQKYLNGNGLMHWRISASGEVTGSGAATDADEDMAWALALADVKWGGMGSLDAPYLELAKTQIQRIWDHEVVHDWGELLNAGDSWNGAIVFNPSYFAPNQYRLFGKLSGNVEGWNKVIDKGYEILEKSMRPDFGNAENGLIAAWTDAEGVPHGPFDGAPTHYQYDSARIPFRIGMDYCEFGEPRAKAYLDKINSFFSGLGAAQIVDGYDLNGMPRAENPDAQSALFVGAAGVAAMSDPRFKPLMDDVWTLLVSKEMTPPSYYYNLSWQVFALLMMSGNLFDYTLHP